MGWLLPELKKQFGGKFYITPAVKFELIDRPLQIKRFKFEALQVIKFLRDGVLEVYEDVPQKEVAALKRVVNSAFKISNKSVDLIQEGEIESALSAIKEGSSIVMDERTLRLLIESSKDVKSLLKRRFHKAVQVDEIKLKAFSSRFKTLNIVRSVELMSVAYKMKLFEDYVPTGKGGRDTLIDAFLWAAKTNGCAMTEHEIEEIKQSLL